MCNLYSVTKSQQAIRDLVKAIRDRLTRGKGFRLDRNQVILRSMRGG